MIKLALKTLATLILFSLISCGDQKPDFFQEIDLEPLAIVNAPAINSYADAVYNGQWLIIGGRIDGLHDHRPEYSYPKDKANKNIWVIDPAAEKVWKKSLEALPEGLYGQLQSTNMSFYQDGDKLIMIGGYGWSNEADNHRTFPYLIVADVPELMAAVKSDSDVQPYLHQIHDERMAVSGGYLGKIDDEYFLVFGNRFDGPYSTQPNKGHVQAYTNEIRKFRLEDHDGISVAGYETIRDSAHFHRRDFNMLPQVFPDGSAGYTAFSGVFQYNRNFPWLYPVNIHKDGYEAVESFEQQFSNYHSACVPVYVKSENRMDNLFFGGMARFFPDPKSGEIINDPLVPSVNTISQVSRFSDGTMKEGILETKMPGLLGASTNFISVKDIPLIHGKIVDFDKLPSGKTLIGYIYGGLESSQPNIFLRPTGTSKSTNKIFKVYLLKQ